MEAVPGTFFDGRSSRREEAVLQCLGTRLSILSAEGGRLAGPEELGKVRISSRIGNTPRFLRFTGGAVFETLHNDAIDRLSARIRPHGQLPHRLESRLRYAAIGLAVIIAFVWGFVRYGIPLLSEHAAFALSAENTRHIGRGMLETLDRAALRPSALPQEEQKRLRARFLAFTDAVDGQAVSVEFRDAGKSFGANAFALPSGTVVFTDQLVRLAKNDEELLGVYAHETGHLARRHALRGLLQQSALAAVIVAVSGDVSSVSSVITAAPAFLVETGYSRDFEREADDYAVVRLQSQGVDLAHFARFLQRLEESHHKGGTREQSRAEEGVQKRWNSYLSTHPPTEERLARIAGGGH